MTSGENYSEMAETLTVLAGANAWSAAREFAAQAVMAGDAVGAKHWRNVARAIMRKDAARLGPPAEGPLMIETVRVAVESAVVEAVVAEPTVAGTSVAEAVLAEATVMETAAAAPVAEQAVVAAPAHAEAGATEAAAVDPVIVEPVVEPASPELPGPARARICAPIPLRARRQAMLAAIEDASGEARVREAA